MPCAEEGVFGRSCEVCGSAAQKVYETRRMDNWCRRRIKCLDCGHRTSTYEVSARDFVRYRHAMSSHLGVMLVSNKLRGLADELDAQKQVMENE